MVEIKAKAGKEDDSPTVKVDYDLPEDDNALIERFSLPIVCRKAREQIVINLQANLRTQLTRDPRPTNDEIQKSINDWKPGTRAPAKSKAEKVDDLYDSMTEGERADLLAKLSGKTKGGKK